jgi:phosphatidylserine decarboxylase
MTVILLFIESLLISSLLYAYLHKKTRISLKYLYLDNLAVALPVAAVAIWLSTSQLLHDLLIFFILVPILIPGLAFTYTMIRFWRTPTRKVKALESEIISPADGNVIYIRRVEAGDVPISIKNGKSFKLDELTKTNLLDTPCWLIGINMTPFDVHKNCSPIKGTIKLTEHFHGKFLSLKEASALVENERNTYVIENEKLRIGVVQIASRLVKKIDVYVKQGQEVDRGDWIGMIRFGSQVDVIIPIQYKPSVTLGQQVYAATSVIASH